MYKITCVIKDDISCGKILVCHYQIRKKDLKTFLDYAVKSGFLVIDIHKDGDLWESTVYG